MCGNSWEESDKYLGRSIQSFWDSDKKQRKGIPIRLFLIVVHFDVVNSIYATVAAFEGYMQHFLCSLPPTTFTRAYLAWLCYRLWASLTCKLRWAGPSGGSCEGLLSNTQECGGQRSCWVGLTTWTEKWPAAKCANFLSFSSMCDQKRVYCSRGCSVVHWFRQ